MKSLSLYEVFNKLCDIESFREDSYLKKILENIHRVKNHFTCLELSAICDVPRSQTYSVLKETLVPQHIVEKTSSHNYPKDWGTYGIGQRKTYRQNHGLPPRGLIPDKYNYTPNKMLKKAEKKKNEKIQKIDIEASSAISEINTQFETLRKIIEINKTRRDK